MPYRAGFTKGTIVCMLFSRNFAGPRLSASGEVREVDVTFRAENQPKANALGLDFGWWAYIPTTPLDLPRVDDMLNQLGKENILPIFIPDITNRWGNEDGLVIRTNDVPNTAAMAEKLVLLAAKATDMPRIIYSAMHLDDALEAKFEGLLKLTQPVLKTVIVLQWSSLTSHPDFSRLGAVDVEWLQVDVRANDAMTYLEEKVRTPQSWLCRIRPIYFKFSFWLDSKQAAFLQRRDELCQVDKT